MQVRAREEALRAGEASGAPVPSTVRRSWSEREIRMADGERQVQLTPAAQSDLEDIRRDTFERWSLEHAHRYHRDLFSTIEALARTDKIAVSVSCERGIYSTPCGGISCSTAKPKLRPT